MSFNVTEIIVADSTDNLKHDFQKATIKLETTSWFLSNCICSWSVEAGELFVTGVKCNYDFDEDDENFVFAHSDNLTYEKSYIKDFWDTDEKQKLALDNVEFIIPNSILQPVYKLNSFQKLTFVKGEFSEINHA